MDENKKDKVKAYIKENENNTQEGWNPDPIKTLTDDLSSLEQETEFWFLSERLRNDKGLLAYAELAMQKEKLSIWKSIKLKLLDMKLSITCPYFEDFKDFLEELKRWKDTSRSDDSKQNDEETDTETDEWSKESKEATAHTFCGVNIDNIKSEPFERSDKNGITRCSKTARNNWKNFNVNLPRGNAYDAWKAPWKDSVKTIPEDKTNEKPLNSWSWIEASSFESLTKWNFADIYTNSKSNYGHRASAFKDDNWEWYVLDPYTRVNWKLDNSPKKLKDYLSVRKIVKANIYESRWYKSMQASDNTESSEWKVEFTDDKVEAAVEWALSTAGDDSFWYEWWWTGKKNGKGWYDCQSFVRAAFIHAWFNVDASWWCGNMREDFEKIWFEWISPRSENDLQEWDILLNPKHTELYAWNGKVVWAHKDKDWKAWDSGWEEISVRDIKKFLGYCKPTGILRYKWKTT